MKRMEANKLSNNLKIAEVCTISFSVGEGGGENQIFDLICYEKAKNSAPSFYHAKSATACTSMFILHHCVSVMELPQNLKP